MQEHEQSVDSVHSRSAGTDQLMGVDGKTDEYEGSTVLSTVAVIEDQPDYDHLPQWKKFLIR